MITLMDNYLLLVALVVLVPEPVSMTDTHKLIKQYFSEELSGSLIKCGLCYSTRPDIAPAEKKQFIHLSIPAFIPTLTHELIPTLTHELIPTLTHELIPTLTHGLIPTLTHGPGKYVHFCIITHNLNKSSQIFDVKQ